MTPLIIFGAKYAIVLLGLAAAGIVFLNRERRLRIAYAALVALPVGYALARLAGVFFSHPQPFAAEGFEPLVAHEVDNSFPSDHMLFGGLFASLAFLADRRAGLALWLLALLVGAARMAAGLHYGVDVLVGAVLALVAVYAAYLLFYQARPSSAEKA